MTVAAPKKEVAPPGFEDTVLGMKKHPEISNPWALAWWMSDQGDVPVGKSKEVGDVDPGLSLIQKWEQFEKTPEYQAYMDKHPAQESNAASSSGQLTRPTKKEGVRVALALGVKLREADVNEANREVTVFIIAEGMGNKADKHFYSKELLERSARLFDGVKAYADHPSKTDEVDRPERSIKDIVGYYHSPKFVEKGGKGGIQAVLKINDGASYDWAWNLVKEAVSYAKKFPDKDLVGISINAWGKSHEQKNGDVVVNVVDDFSEVNSADIVTQAGAGGRFLGIGLREAVKKALTREADKGGSPMKDALLKHAEAMKGIRDAMKKDPAHEAAYGAAMDEAMGHIAGLMKKEGEAEVDAPLPDAAHDKTPKAGAPEPDADDKEGEAYEKKEAARYQAGKMTPSEKKIYETLLAERAEKRIKENADMVAKYLAESGLPDLYKEDLRVLCVGRVEADVKKLVEARKKLVETITGNRANGSGAGEGAKPNGSKLKEALGKAGVPIKK